VLPHGLDTIFDYLALLISEREPGQPFLLSQIQPAILYKFPDFNFAAYGLANLRAFVVAGEQAGFFRLVNTGNIQTAYLELGSKRPPAPSMAAPTALADLGVDDPRRTRWMTDVLEALLNAERADAIVEVIRGAEVFTPAFDAFLVSQERTMELYAVRGKVRRLREFLMMYRDQGETAAAQAWKTSRAVLRTPVVPPLKDAPRAGSMIWGVLQGKIALHDVPLETINNMFFGVLRFYREQMAREKAWDWVSGLIILEQEARAIPRPEPQQKRGLFGGGKTQAPTWWELDEGQIAAIAQQLLREAGIRSTQDETAVWRGYLEAEGFEASFQFLAERPALLKSDRLVGWLDEQISQGVTDGDMKLVRVLANKAAIVVAVRQMGLERARQTPGELKNIYESVVSGAELLGLVLGYLKSGGTAQALDYLNQHRDMLEDESIGALLDEQLIRAAKQGDVKRYRLISERVDLWRNVTELGAENGSTQHARFLSSPREDKMLLAEMGLLLLAQVESVEERRDILERYPAVATAEGLAMANGMLEMLSFRNVDPAEYNRHFEIKRLIERCLQIGIDRALVELK
jgi:hypothetical protein